MFEATLIDVGVAFLLIIAFAEWAKIRRKSEKGFGWLAAAGVFFLFAGTRNAAIIPGLYGYLGDLWLDTLFATIGWILALVGTLFIGYETLLKMCSFHTQLMHWSHLETLSLRRKWKAHPRYFPEAAALS